jgi:hypothetical protein
LWRDLSILALSCEITLFESYWFFRLASISTFSFNNIIFLMQQATVCLADLDQSPLTTTRDSMNPFFNAIVKPELLKHQDKDVKLLVATCICEITRITAPEPPYNDEILKVPFFYLDCLLIVSFLIHNLEGQLFPFEFATTKSWNSIYDYPLS